jgi:hypothetical protein
MGYSIFIEKDNADITLEDWKDAVSSINGIRLDSESVVGMNPKTNESISISGSEGDVSILFKTGGFLGFRAKEEWRKALYFQNGHAQFNATEDIEDPKNPVHIAASKLAKSLSAKIRGEADEEYIW